MLCQLYHSVALCCIFSRICFHQHNLCMGALYVNYLLHVFGLSAVIRYAQSLLTPLFNPLHCPVITVGVIHVVSFIFWALTLLYKPSLKC
jgi:hypothetical protein